MLQSLRNIWDVPDLRKRVLFTLGCWPCTAWVATSPPRGSTPRPSSTSSSRTGANWFGLRGHLLGREPGQGHVFALGIMPYISASIILQLLTVVWPYLEKLSKEGRAGPAQDHPVHALRHGAAVHRPVAGHRALAQRAHDPQQSSASWRPRLGLPAHDRAHPHHRHGLHHVAGRADHRARDRQRDLLHHLRRHRGRLPRRSSAPSRQIQRGELGLCSRPSCWWS